MTATPMILRCPECKAPASHLSAEQDAVILYSVHVDPTAPDGIATYEQDVSGLKEWRLNCNDCGEQSEAGDSWTADWLIEEGN